MTILQNGFLILVALLLPFAIGRWMRTHVFHPERRVRGDVAALLALMLLGQSGSLLRDWALDRFGVISIGYWACNIALLGIAVAALFLLNRLYRAYRQSHSADSAARPLASPAAPPSVKRTEVSKDRTQQP